MRIRTTADLGRLDFAKGAGLLPVIAQDAINGTILMLAWTNREALELTLEEGELWYWSRSRQRLWKKGETSGNIQRLVALYDDCDADALVALVEPTGPSCHTGRWSCFSARPSLVALEELLEERVEERPEGSYTTQLLEDENLRLKKLGEEAIELALACSNPLAPASSTTGIEDKAAAVREEAADLIYHALIAALGAGVTTTEVLRALDERLPR